MKRRGICGLSSARRFHRCENLKRERPGKKKKKLVNNEIKVLNI